MYLFEGNEVQGLLKAPEYGMGYQRIRAKLNDGRSKTGYVFNAELFVPDNHPILQRLVERQITFAKALTIADRASSSITSFEIIPRYVNKPPFGGQTLAKNFLQESKGATDGPVESTKTGEIFKRFTAYRNDRRITPNGGLLPGSYATTEADAGYAATGRQAVARYALPNLQPAIYVFTIKPSSGTTIQRGTVQPANDQPGGGAEVFFSAGTADKTVTVPPSEIPEG
ncbi:MAG TPA: hypothetical protein VJS89_07365 [Gammaproteobacteria bacterium]|nr:hypothetical protein [Gammaproteobacteria bacterium]